MNQAAAEHVANAGGVAVMAVCMAMVILYAFNRYNTPATNRLTTTRSLFYLTGCCYIMSSLGLFFGLSEVVLRPGMLKVLGLENGQELAAELSAPLLSAIILTTMLPNVPWVSTADKWLLQFFQDWGRIPTGVSHLANRMPQNALFVGDKDIADLSHWISHTATLPNKLISCLGADPDAPSGWLARVMLIYTETEKLQFAPNYADAFKSMLGNWQALHADFFIFTSQSHAYFVLFESLKSQEAETIQKALLQAQEDYKDRCDKIYRNLTEFLAQMLLMSERSGHMIDNCLRGIGYEIGTVEDVELPIGQFAFMGVVLMIVLISIVAFFPQTQNKGSLPLPVIAMLIGCTKAIGAAAAVLPKLRWSLFRKSDQGERPFLGWIISACAAGVISLAFERAAVAMSYGSIDVVFNFKQYPLTPLAPTSFIICLAISILCDVDFHLGRGWMRQVKEAVICGLVMMITVIICLHLAHLHATTAFPYAVSTLLGLVTGFFGPFLYRTGRKEEFPVLGLKVSTAPNMGAAKT